MHRPLTVSITIITSDGSIIHSYGVDIDSLSSGYDHVLNMDTLTFLTKTTRYIYNRDSITSIQITPEN